MFSCILFIVEEKKKVSHTDKPYLCTHAMSSMLVQLKSLDGDHVQLAVSRPSLGWLELLRGSQITSGLAYLIYWVTTFLYSSLHSLLFISGRFSISLSY